MNFPSFSLSSFTDSAPTLSLSPLLSGYLVLSARITLSLLRLFDLPHCLYRSLFLSSQSPLVIIFPVFPLYFNVCIPLILAFTFLYCTLITCNLNMIKHDYYCKIRHKTFHLYACYPTLSTFLSFQENFML